LEQFYRTFPITPTVTENAVTNRFHKMFDLYFQRFFSARRFWTKFSGCSPRNLAYRFGLPCAILRDFFRIKYFEHKNSRSFSAQFLCADFHANFLRDFPTQIFFAISYAFLHANDYETRYALP